MTTSFALAVRGHMWDAAATQPAGAALALFCAVCVWISLWTTISGSRIGPMAYYAIKPWHLWVGLGILFGAWAYVGATWT